MSTCRIPLPSLTQIVIAIAAWSGLISAMPAQTFGQPKENDKVAVEIEAQPGIQIAKEFVAKVGQGDDARRVTIPYLLFVPKSYDASGDRWPLILFLHGLGECGNGNLDKVKVHGPPKIVQQQAEFPFVVISPQCPRPKNHYRAAWQQDQLVQLVDQVVGQLHVDRRRVYVTGLSMGGYGTWRLAATYPDRFAAAVPICGGGKPAFAKALAKLPIWCFHGARDNVVPVSQSEEMVAAVKAAGGNAKLTIYPKAGHNSWTATYDNPELYKWLLAQRRDGE